jgi:hypothetical protein
VSRKGKFCNIKPSATAASVIPEVRWGAFLESFGRSHHGWPTRIETKDTVTKEQVVSHESPLESIELDLEDQRNPRINVSVKLDNKLVKHILFLPSRVVHRTRGDDREESLEIETLNTDTIVHFRPREV